MGQNAELVSTVLGVNSYSGSYLGEKQKCDGASIAHKIAHKDVLKWISENWVK